MRLQQQFSGSWLRVSAPVARPVLSKFEDGGLSYRSTCSGRASEAPIGQSGGVVPGRRESFDAPESVWHPPGYSRSVRLTLRHLCAWASMTVWVARRTRCCPQISRASALSCSFPVRSPHPSTWPRSEWSAAALVR